MASSPEKISGVYGRAQQQVDISFFSLFFYILDPGLSLEGECL